jgi:hypothetical protein
MFFFVIFFFRTLLPRVTASYTTATSDDPHGPIGKRVHYQSERSYENECGDYLSDDKELWADVVEAQGPKCDSKTMLMRCTYLFFASYASCGLSQSLRGCDEPRSYSHNAVGLAAADRTQRPADAAGAEDEDACPREFQYSRYTRVKCVFFFRSAASEINSNAVSRT